jgi:catechol 2,3-dioxygenase-like lactoylglutathione lyase family enzyme
MDATNDTSQRNEITIRVSDPDRARAFYQDLFGLQTDAESSWDDQVLVSPQGAPEAFQLRLVTGERTGPSGDIWLSMQVGSITEVLDLYLLAIMIGGRATLPRKRGDRWNTVITDPDGHHVSVWTNVPAEATAPQHARRSPRWEWERAQRPGYEAGGARVHETESTDSHADAARGSDHPGSAPGGRQVYRSKTN